MYRVDVTRAARQGLASCPLAGRRIGRIFADVALSGLSFFLATVLHGVDIAEGHELALPTSLVVFCGISTLVYLQTGLYQTSWRFASVPDFFIMVRDVVIAVSLFIFMSRLFEPSIVPPVSVPVIATFIMITSMGAMRLMYRCFFDGSFSVNQACWMRTKAPCHRPTPLLAYGATCETDAFLRSLQSAKSREYEVVGILDDDPRSRDRRVHGVHVLGRLGDLPRVLESFSDPARKPTRLVLPARGIERDKLREIIDAIAGSGLRAVRIPHTCDLLQKASEAFTFEPVSVHDLLGRAPVALRLETIDSLVRGKSVVVTGGGGSIGSELCRQILKRDPARLIIVDHSEFNLFNIERELAPLDLQNRVQPILASVRDHGRILRLFKETEVDLVFHAAAYKHVPLVEANPVEGVLTNVVGTSYVADAAVAAGAAAMIMISTDKAVKPHNTMGLSKRVAEGYCQSLDLDCGRRGRRTRFMVVRFGNVLGSSGSVVPIFEQQIKRGGPVTVTDPDMTRYFMTIPEAVELVLQGAAFGLDDDAWAGAILVLEMGEPVSILDLARRMIALAGFVPDRDIAIEFTGVRRGEKLHEELFDENEALESTDVPGIRLARSHIQDFELMRDLRDRVVAAGALGDVAALMSMLRSATKPASAVATATGRSKARVDQVDALDHGRAPRKAAPAGKRPNHGTALATRNAIAVSPSTSSDV